MSSADAKRASAKRESAKRESAKRESTKRQSTKRQPKAKLESGALSQPEGFNWLRLNKLTFTDEAGKTRAWEAAERTTRKGAVDAVAILAMLHGGKMASPAVILISQFRPPCNGYVLELPAGLVDAGETPEEAALRELKEECGYVGTCESASPIVWCDPGMTNANMHFVRVSIDMADPRNQKPKAELEDGEFIKTHLVPVSELASALADTKKAFGEPFQVDARLYAVVMGLSLGEAAAPRTTCALM